ncbi:MAG: MFS transporter [Pseudomonadota bacterium]
MSASTEHEARSPNAIQRLLSAASKVQPNETQATVLSFLWAFIVMAAYYVIRAGRDALSSDWTDAQLSWLWTSTFVFSAIAVSIYGIVVSSVRFRIIVPTVYGLFASTFIGFYIAGTTLGDNDLVNRAFYVWVSVFALFHLSVFWTFMTGLYNKEQSKRLFSVIATGAIGGAITGPAIVTLIGEQVGPLNMLLVASVMLLSPIPIMSRLERLRATSLNNPDSQEDLLRGQKLGVNPFSGFTRFVTHPYLLWIGVFILLYVTMNTFLYYEIRKVFSGMERAARYEAWAMIDLAVNSLAAVTALFATGRITTRLGISVTMALVPLIMLGGWVVVAMSPVLASVVGVQIVRRAGNYAITRPGREMLFTVVDSETRFKSKPVIDTVVYRGGDVATAWFYTLLTTKFGLALSGIAVVGAVIAGVWAAVGVKLGRLFDRRQRTVDSETAE